MCWKLPHVSLSTDSRAFLCTVAIAFGLNGWRRKRNPYSLEQCQDKCVTTMGTVYHHSHSNVYSSVLCDPFGKHSQNSQTKISHANETELKISVVAHFFGFIKIVWRMTHIRRILMKQPNSTACLFPLLFFFSHSSLNIFFVTRLFSHSYSLLFASCNFGPFSFHTYGPLECLSRLNVWTNTQCPLTLCWRWWELLSLGGSHNFLAPLVDGSWYTK